MNASHAIRFLVAVVAIHLALACHAAPTGAIDDPVLTTNRTHLQAELDTLAMRARPGILGVTVIDTDGSIAGRVNADRAYPMMSVFKAPVAAVVLQQIEDGRLSLEQRMTLTRADIRPGSAIPSIGAHFRGERMTFTLDRLLTAAVSESDNTAADALLKLAGGPQVVTAFLRAHGIEGMRVDLDERGIGRIFDDLAPGKEIPRDETAKKTEQRLRRGFAAYLADPRNRATPDAAAAFLRKLTGNELLPPAATQHLLRLMVAQTVPNRLRAGLPDGVRLADKCGTSGSLGGRTAAYNDIGILVWPDGKTIIVAAFLTDSHASKAERDALFADLGKMVAASANR